MNEYYYLNSRNAPQGPHSLDELAALMAQGNINPTTLVSYKGAATWEPLGNILNKEDIPMPEVTVEPGQVGCCPTCRHDLAAHLSQGQLPAFCPNCARPFSTGKPGIHPWSSFCLALRNYARFTGRATREEFWSFQLFNFLIIMVLYITIIVGVIQIIGTEVLATLQGQDEEAMEAALNQAIDAQESLTPLLLILGGFFSMFVWIVFTMIPHFSVLVRRLHDVGWSGKWVLLYFLLSFAMGASFSLAAMSESSTLAVLSLVLNLVVTVLGFTLLVLALLDSKRGPNKYGPGSKYPLG